MAFLPLANSDHVAASVSIDFPINSKQYALFHHMACEYSRTEWNGAECDVTRGISLNSFCEFCEWAQVRIDVYIPHRKYLFKPH